MNVNAHTNVIQIRRWSDGVAECVLPGHIVSELLVHVDSAVCRLDSIIISLVSNSSQYAKPCRLATHTVCPVLGLRQHDSDATWKCLRSGESDQSYVSLLLCASKWDCCHIIGPLLPQRICQPKESCSSGLKGQGGIRKHPPEQVVGR